MCAAVIGSAPHRRKTVMNFKKSLECVLLACVLLIAAGCFNVQFKEPKPPAGVSDLSTSFDPSYYDAVYGSPTSAPAVTTASVSSPLTTAPIASSTAPAVTTATPAQAATTAPAAGTKTPDTMSNAELLTYFNQTVNKVKLQSVGFTKTKKTDILDYQLSNSAANAVVSMVKSALLSSNSESQTVPKGASGVDVFSPSGKHYVSTLTEADITSITCTKADAGYVIKVAVKGETNPGEGSAMSRAFDYMTVEDVMTTYAPKAKATVEQNNIKVVFSDCTAELTIDAAGNIQKYTTYVKGVMNLINATVTVFTTDVAVTLASTTDYTNFVY